MSASGQSETTVTTTPSSGSIPERLHGPVSGHDYVFVTVPWYWNATCTPNTWPVPVSCTPATSPPPLSCAYVPVPLTTDQVPRNASSSSFTIGYCRTSVRITSMPRFPRSVLVQRSRENNNPCVVFCVRPKGYTNVALPESESAVLAPMSSKVPVMSVWPVPTTLMPSGLFARRAACAEGSTSPTAASDTSTPTLTELFRASTSIVLSSPAFRHQPPDLRVSNTRS